MSSLRRGMALDFLESRPSDPARGAGPTPPPALGRKGDDGPRRVLGDPARFGLLVFLGTISMMFIGFTSAYLVRQTAPDWRPLSAPPILWWNSGALLLSSLSLERARRSLRAGELAGARAGLAATGVLGLLFAAGQLQAWRILTAAGLSLASNPHSSFFYVLSGVHVVHLLSAIVWWAVALSMLQRASNTPGRDVLRQFATYWHFLAGLWLYLMYVLFVL